MAETKRAPARTLDAASDQMAELLRRADALLAEWSQFGAAVRGQVEREAGQIGHAVGAAVETATERAAGAAVERAIADRIGAQLAAISAEVGKLETRARAASRAITEQRRRDRGLLIGLVVAVLIANGLLVALLLRKSDPIVLPAAEPVPVAPRAGSIEPPVTPPLEPPTPEGAGSADSKGDAKQPADSAKTGSNGVKAEPANAPVDAKSGKPDQPVIKAALPPRPAEPAHRPIKQGAPTGTRRP